MMGDRMHKGVDLRFRVRVPAPSRMLVANLLGVLGLLGVAVAVGGLTHSPWWALLVGAVEAVVLAVISSTHGDDTDESDDLVLRNGSRREVAKV